MRQRLEDMKVVLNEELPEDLREALEYDAELRGLTLSDTATRVLCEHFGVEWQRSDRKFRPAADRFKLRIPESLHREIRLQAADTLQTMRGIILNVLTKHYKTTIVDPHRRSRRREVA